ncbi:hypothetical protein R5R35_002714 [Gryllus longicercus]|uniref:tRNA (cytosine(38)-C(5))-methyltransferase n=1 Tax=Gryllus longicercus TaxID=2509291 RepID=A0AAN9Z5U3_9ORTH
MGHQFKVLELYSGIGGMHYAVEESGLSASFVAAVDINEVANSVYKHNFPSSMLLQRNISSLTPKEVNALKPDVIMMSPPCQPFTRVGLKKDIEDGRTDSFLHVLAVLPELHSVQYVLLENVKGFEISEARNKLISALEMSGFIHQEFLLSPHNFFIPNVRLRYYLIAKRSPRKFCFPISSEVMTSFPFSLYSPEREKIVGSSCEVLIAELQKKLHDIFNLHTEDLHCETFSIKKILESDLDENQFLVSSKTLAKYAQILDIVTPESKKSCCFTKAYGHYVEGTGSVLCPFSKELIHQTFEKCKDLDEKSDEYTNLLRNLHMRYFTPGEIARLMCFPPNFSFPQSITLKQKYRLLGNSINVHVVALLFVLLVHEE